jgi:hypothetical protein
LQFLHYLDAQDHARRRRDLASAAAVIVSALTPGGGGIGLKDAWPEFFVSAEELAFPQVGADMSEFSWETPTPESYERDLKLMGALEENEHISVREEPGAAVPARMPDPDPEWP